MSAVEPRTFRAETLEEALVAVRKQLGPDAIVVRQREGIIGGIGGFFGKRCYEVDAEAPPPLPAAPKPMAMPAQAITSAYGGGDTAGAEPEADHIDDIFSSLLDETSVFASTLAEAMDETSEPELEPEPAFEPIALEELAPPPAVELARLEPAEQPLAVVLSEAGIDVQLAESLVDEAKSQLRVFDPTEPFVNQVRETLAQRIPTKRLNGRYKRRVIALVGPLQSGKTAAAARLCEAHAAAGRRVAALSLEPMRQALELGNLTDHLDIEFVAADHPGLIDFAVQKVARAETVIIDTPAVASGDEAGWARLAMLLGPLKVHETHLVLPGMLLPAGVDAFIGAASQALQVDRLLLTHLDLKPGPGPAVAAAIKAGIPISATATADRLVPADPYRLAAALLP
jgi:flagellar biosynthesis GTPase FlhF